MSALVELIDQWLAKKYPGELNEFVTNNSNNMKINVSFEISVEEIMHAISDKGFNDLSHKLQKVEQLYLQSTELNTEKIPAKVGFIKTADLEPAAPVKTTTASPVTVQKSAHPLSGKTNSLKGKPAGKTTKTCAHCNGSYQGFNSQVYCSDACKAAAKQTSTGSVPYIPVSPAAKPQPKETKTTPVPIVTTVPAQTTTSEQPMSNNAAAETQNHEDLSWFKRKKLEQAKAKADQAELDSLKVHPKIDWKEAKKAHALTEHISI